MISNNEQQTLNFGKDLAKKLKGGEVILLIGDLGAGKTTLVKGVAKELGIEKHVTSPTFVLMKVYEIQNSKSKVQELVHIDTYRGLGIDDLENIGALEYFGQNDTICLVEWGSGLEKYLIDNQINHKIITIKNINQNTREIIISNKQESNK